MKMPDFINTRAFHIKDNTYSVCLVEDLRNHTFYQLKNELAQEWEKSEYKEQFLFDVRNNKSLKCTINTKSKNFKYFSAHLGEFFVENNIIDTLHLELNYKCNLNCKHCFTPENMDEYSISFEQAKKIIDEAYFGNVYGITLTGGECTINNDFLKIAKYVREKRMPLSVLTNAQKLYDDENLFNELLNIYPSDFKISLYSMNSNEHDYITGVKGSYHKTLSIIKRLREKNINVHIACPQLSYNIGSHKEVKEFAEKIGAEFLTGCHFIYNKNNNNLTAKCTYDNIEQFYCDTLDMNNIRNFKKSDGRICGAGKNILSIRPNLDITPCVGFNHVLGNYNSTSLKELQENILPKFREKFIKSNLKECFKYDYCKYCQYCSLQATHETGFLKKSPTLCEDAKAYLIAYLKHKQ